MAGLWRLILLVLVVGSAVLTLRAAALVAASPGVSPLVDRTAAEITAATDRLIATEATQGRLDAFVDRRLAEDPRNWIALDALAEVYAERGLTPPARLAEAREADSGILAAAGSCASCLWDIRACTLSTALICKAPILLTPIEDLRGVTKAGIDYALGTEVDRLDLALSAVGLGATALVVATGGSSATLKAGTSLVKLARGMRLLSPRLVAQLTAALTDGVRWADLPTLRPADDLAALFRPDAIAPAVAILSDLGRVQGALDTTRTLHLLPLVDDAADASRLARVAEALGPRTVSRAEVLGKSGLLRATIRLSDTALQLAFGLAAFLTGLGAAVAHLVQTLLLRHLRRSARRDPGPPARPLSRG